MWLTAPNRIGLAGWQTDQSVWMVESRGGFDGVRLQFGNTCVSIQTADVHPLPMLEEQFVRGDELHLSFPQSKEGTSFGFRVVLRPVSCDEFSTTNDRAYFELLISIQTSLLDSYPSLDLFVPKSNQSEAHYRESNEVTGDLGEIHHVQLDGDRAAILMGPQDAPFASQPKKDASKTKNEEGLRIRLFGEFLEKGVICRARPWLVLDRGDQAIDHDELSRVWKRLVESPVPLD